MLPMKASNLLSTYNLLHHLTVFMWASRMPINQGPGYICVVGRHILPHVYHKVDETKLFCASRKASRALATLCLPANYPPRCMPQWRVGNTVGMRGFNPPHIVPCGSLIRRRPPFFAL